MPTAGVWGDLRSAERHGQETGHNQETGYNHALAFRRGAQIAGTASNSLSMIRSTLVPSASAL